MPVTSCDTLAAELNALHGSGMTWRDIARQERFSGIKPGTLCSIAKGYEPKSPDLRAKLGLPPTATVVSVNGPLPDGTQVTSWRTCANPDCDNTFADNNPQRRYCYECRPKRGGKEKRDD